MRFVLFLKGGIVLKRVLCLLLILLFALSLCVPAFADSEALFCRKCGKPIPTDSNFCPYCGAAVTVDAKNAAASPRSDTPTVTVPTVPAAPQSAALSSGGRLDYSTILNRVRVTKSPTSESVPYGGSCTFIAHAANATSVTWIITTSDGSISAPAYEAANSISGLYVSGANTDTLKLSGIPSWMNGCMVQACFTGEGGPVYTEAARIWTYQPKTSKSSDEGGMLWWWPYRYYIDPYTWEAPWWYWYNEYTGEPSPPDVNHSITLPGGHSIAPQMPGPNYIYDWHESVVTRHEHTSNQFSPDGNGGSGNTGDNTGGNTGDNTGGNTGDNTGGSTGGNTGNNTGDNTGDNTGGSTGGSTGGNTGGSTGGSTGGNTGGNTGDNTGGSTGGSTGGGTGGTPQPDDGTHNLPDPSNP